MKRLVFKSSALKRDSFLVFVMILTMLVLNFIGLARHHSQVDILTSASALQRHLGVSAQAMALTNLEKQEEETSHNSRQRALGLLDFDYIGSHLLNDSCHPEVW